MASDYQVLDVKIANLEKDISEMKNDIKEQKETYIENMFILRENLTRLTALMEKHDEHLRKQDHKLEKQDQMLSSINNKVGTLRQTIESKTEDNKPSDLSWYQRMIENKEKFFMYILLVLLAFVLGIKLETITGFLGGK